MRAGPRDAPCANTLIFFTYFSYKFLVASYYIKSGAQPFFLPSCCPGPALFMPPFLSRLALGILSHHPFTHRPPVIRVTCHNAVGMPRLPVKALMASCITSGSSPIGDNAHAPGMAVTCFLSYSVSVPPPDANMRNEFEPITCIVVKPSATCGMMPPLVLAHGLWIFLLSRMIFCIRAKVTQV